MKKLLIIASLLLVAVGVIASIAVRCDYATEEKIFNEMFKQIVESSYSGGTNYGGKLDRFVELRRAYTKKRGLATLGRHWVNVGGKVTNTPKFFRPQFGQEIPPLTREKCLALIAQIRAGGPPHEEPPAEGIASAIP